MRMILVGLSAALLVGCGGVSVSNNNSGNAAAAPANTTATAPPLNPANMVMPGGEEDAGGGNVSAGGGGGGDRASLLASCTQEAGAALPAGTDVAALCGCAVDRALAGARRADAMRQCATAQNVRLPTGP